MIYYFNPTTPDAQHSINTNITISRVCSIVTDEEKGRIWMRLAIPFASESAAYEKNDKLKSFQCEQNYLSSIKPFAIKVLTCDLSHLSTN